MRRTLPTVLAVAVLLAGCADDATDSGATTAPPTTTAAPTTTTAAPATSSTAAPTTTAAPVVLYAPADPPTVPEATTEIPADNNLPDGVYYGVARTGEAPGVVMEMTQLLTGAACVAWAERTGESCDNDYAVVGDPQAYRPVPDDAFVTVARADGPGTSYRIDVAELLRLVQGETPAAAAPAGYTWTPFPFIITLEGGRITRLEQWWVP